MSVSAAEMTAGQSLANLIDDLAESVQRCSGKYPTQIVVADIDGLAPLADFMLIPLRVLKERGYHGMTIRVDPFAPAGALYLLPFPHGVKVP